jgi:TonB family protein
VPRPFASSALAPNTEAERKIDRTDEMTFRIPIRSLAALGSSLLLAAAAYSQGRGAPVAPAREQRLAEVKSGSFAVRDGQQLRLFTDIGSIRIRTQNSGQLSYHVRIEADPREPDAQKYISKLLLSARAVPEGVSITAHVPWREFRGHLWVTFELSIPRNFQLDVTTQAGSIETEAIDGRASLVTSGGNLLAARIGGAARLETQGGHITVQDVAGDLTAISGGGHITAGNIKGDAVIRTAGGHIRVASVQGTVQLETGGGNISLQQAGANVVANTGGGRISLGDTSGDIRARTAGGNIGVLRALGPTQLETAGGSICLTKVQGSIHATTSAGTITAWFIPEGRLLGPSQLESTSGDIIVYIPRLLPVTIDATVGSGSDYRIDADPAIPLKVSYAGTGVAGRVVRGEAALNGGGEVLRLKTVTGNIRLRLSESPRMGVEPSREALQRQIERQIQMQQEFIQHQLDQMQQLQGKRVQEAIKAQERETSRLLEWRRRLKTLWTDRVSVDYSEQNLRLVKSVQPIYPSLARLQRVEGVVRLEVKISKEGAVEDVDVESGHPLLVPAAVEAVKQWRYRPFLLNGQAVPVVTKVDIEFRLN